MTIKNLVKMANQFDETGMHRAADYIDELLIALAQQEGGTRRKNRKLRGIEFQPQALDNRVIRAYAYISDAIEQLQNASKENAKAIQLLQMAAQNVRSLYS